MLKVKDITGIKIDIYLMDHTSMKGFKSFHADHPVAYTRLPDTSKPTLNG